MLHTSPWPSSASPASTISQGFPKCPETPRRLVNRVSAYGASVRRSCVSPDHSPTVWLSRTPDAAGTDQLAASQRRISTGSPDAPAVPKCRNVSERSTMSLSGRTA